MNMRSSRARLVVAAVLSLLLIPAVSSAQQWSAAQKEVWKNVEAYSALAEAGDVEGFMSYYHPEYLGWNYDSALPMSAESAKKFLEYSFKTTKSIAYVIQPAAIIVHGDFAIVHYYYAGVYKDAEGKEKSGSGRWTDILIKQGDKWVMIADHGGQTSKN
jgi:ketosteroid isomerase-like protein